MANPVYTGYGMPQMDFSPIGNLPQDWRAAQDYAQQQRIREARNNLGDLVKAGATPEQIARSLIGAGDIEGGQQFMRLADVGTQRALEERRVKLAEEQAAEPKLTQVPGLLGPKPMWAYPKTGEFRAPQPYTGGAAAAPTPAPGVGARPTEAGTGETPAPAPRSQLGGMGEMGVDAAGNQLEGEDFLKTFSPAEQRLIKGVTSYSIPVAQLPRNAEARAGLMTAASLYDKNFDYNNYETIQKTMSGYLAPQGAPQKVITGFNTALEHVATGLDNVESLGNWNRFKAVNPYINMARSQYSTQYQEARKAIETDVQAIANELTSVFRGSGHPSEREAMEWKEKFPIDGSQVEMRTAFREAARLLGGRIHEQGISFNRGVGEGSQRARDPYSWVSPAALGTYNFATTMDAQQPIPQDWRRRYGATIEPAPAAPGAQMLTPQQQQMTAARAALANRM